ncbi:MAG: hypothetical protein J7L07_05235 [Candidatus Odinarchaeota archaeon]|nr:hypothetical protein [Candidatus Odinarchaeota archaeon]
MALVKEEPRTATELANILGINHVSVNKRLMKLVIAGERIKMKKIGRYEIFWYDFYSEFMKNVAKNMFGEKLSKEDLVLVNLLDRDATSPDSAIPIREIGDKDIFKRHIEEKRVVLTDDGKVYLTEIGVLIARGLKDIWIDKSH